MSVFLLMIGAYLLGSVPPGLIIAKFRGVDIRKAGSGNIGATNVLRSVGKTEAILTLLADVGKGIIPVVIARLLSMDDVAAGVVGLAAVSGHVFSVFLKFRGGKGVATALGVLAAYAPGVCLITMLLWLIVFAVARISSLGAVVSFFFLPFAAALVDGSRGKIFVSSLIALLVLVRHADNIRRLIRGTEPRAGKKS